MNNDTKIEISVGCSSFLVREIDSLRAENKILSAEKRIVDGFFTLLNRIGDKPSFGMTDDLLHQAKKEISQAVEKAKLDSMPRAMDHAK